MHVACKVIKAVMESQYVIFALSLQCPVVTATVQKCGALILRTCAVFRNVHLYTKGREIPLFSKSFINDLLCINVFAVPLYPATH